MFAASPDTSARRDRLGGAGQLDAVTSTLALTASNRSSEATIHTSVLAGAHRASAACVKESP
jgi:hypothetical protein